MAETTKSTTPTLPKSVFNVDVQNHELLKLAYDSYLAAGRNAHPRTLERGDVRGGGKKPWRQKGTGRARFGSTRNPIWRGGGIVFGPTGTENHVKKLSTTSKRTALKQALSLANKAKKIVIMANKAKKIVITDVKTTGKTAEVAKFLADKKLDRKVLLVVDEKTLEMIRATKNIQNVVLIRANYLSVFHILNADHIVLAPKAVAVIENWLAAKEEK